jgi:CHAT domain-containing protein
VQTVLVLYDEPHIPWELIKPYRRDPVRGTFQQGEPFWGERFVLTHWLRGRPPADHLSLRHMVAVGVGEGPGGALRDMRAAPGAPPPVPGMMPLSGVQEEVESLRTLERRGTRVEVIPPRRDRVHAALERGGFDVFHLACHGSFGGADNADASAVRLEDGLLHAAELSPELAASLRRTAPLVFFNACHTGRLGFSLTRLGSWGARLLELGCGGFVGTLWPVSDRAALAFARAFYESLASGQGVGQAVWQARQEVRRQFPGDPTWLAYCCFADPHARSHQQAAPVMPLDPF